MAGKFANISENDWSRDDGSVFLKGYTHGCGCCSDEYPVTKEDLFEHIESLQLEIDATKELLKKWFKY